MPTIDRKKKLGRGLGALMGETKREEPLVDTSGANNADSQQSHGRDSRLVSIPVSSISPLKGQPRTNFDDAALDEAAGADELRLDVALVVAEHEVEYGPGAQAPARRSIPVGRPSTASSSGALGRTW